MFDQSRITVSVRGVGGFERSWKKKGYKRTTYEEIEVSLIKIVESDSYDKLLKSNESCRSVRSR
jgi:hypothetical protein